MTPFAACAGDALMHELERICDLQPNGRPVWIFFLGHANSAHSQVRYNLPGPDIRFGEIAAALRTADVSNGMAIFLTTAASGKCLKELAAPGRVLVTATSPAESDNETDFPHALVETLEAPSTDLDADGYVSILEVFSETVRRVRGLYEAQGLVLTECALLDGNGDGRGSALPDEEDARPAHEMTTKAVRRPSLNE